MDRLKDKVVILSGGNSGIGACAAKLFAAEGAKVVISARRVEALDAVAEEIRQAGGEVLAIPCDISKPEQCAAVGQDGGDLRHGRRAGEQRRGAGQRSGCHREDQR